MTISSKLLTCMLHSSQKVQYDDGGIAMLESQARSLGKCLSTLLSCVLATDRSHSCC